MEPELTPEIRKAIIAMSKNVARRRNLNEEGRLEIEGHIEDKILAYLRTEEKLTGEDALLLAREHFGAAPDFVEEMAGETETSPPASTPSQRVVAESADAWKPVVFYLSLYAFVMFIAGFMLDTLVAPHRSILWSLAGIVAAAIVYWQCTRNASSEKFVSERSTAWLVLFLCIATVLYSTTSMATRRMNLLTSHISYDIVGLGIGIALIVVAFAYFRKCSESGGALYVLIGFFAWNLWHMITFEFHRGFYSIANTAPFTATSFYSTSNLGMTQEFNFQAERLLNPGTQIMGGMDTIYAIGNPMYLNGNKDILVTAMIAVALCICMPMLSWFREKTVKPQMNL